MPKTTRTEEILRLVNSHGSISVSEISEKIYASPSTVRRELEKLEQEGLLRRHHGGAESVLTLRPPQIVRRQLNQEAKNAVALRASRLVTAGSTIFIDASTTVQYMIPYLSSVEGLTVYTNGIDTAVRLLESKVRAICTGGELFAESMAYVGHVAADTIRKTYFDALFFSSAGFDDEVISDWSESESILRRVLVEQSAKCYFLADASKRGKRYTHIVCRMTEIAEFFCQ